MRRDAVAGARMNDLAVGPLDDLPLRDRRRPPAPQPPRGKLGWFALYRGLRNNPITTWGQEAYEKPILADQGLMGDFAIVNRPDAIRHVFLDNAANYPKDAFQLEKLGPALGHGLLTSERDEWRFQRRTVAPLFQPSSVAAYFPVMVDAVAEMLARWEAAAAEGALLDAAREMTALTYEIISRTVFSSEIETGSDAMSAAITRFFDTHGRIDLWDIVKLPRWLPRPAEWRVRPATRVFREEVRRLLQRRRERQAAGQPVPNDLVTLLAAARDPETGAALPEQTIHDNLVTFIGAGHETTANALGWTLFLLSEYPWAFDRMAQEVDAVLSGRAPTLEDVPHLNVVRMTLEEAMRLYPPVPFLSREAVGPDRIDGVEIAPGTLVIVAPWLVHRHRLLWREPDLFEPERFAPERRAKIPRFAYLPFGAGARVCIGAGFAMQEALIALAMIVQRFRPRMVPGAYVQPVARITLRPARGLPMRIERRR
jgi:cytochrome P450